MKHHVGQEHMPRHATIVQCRFVKSLLTPRRWLVSGATKNALDYLWAGFAETSKPVMIVGYGVLGGMQFVFLSSTPSGMIFDSAAAFLLLRIVV